MPGTVQKKTPVVVKNMVLVSIVLLDPLHTHYVVLDLTGLPDQEVEEARDLHGVGEGDPHQPGLQAPWAPWSPRYCPPSQQSIG